MTAAPRAVVFANHDVGVRCLEALLAAGVEVPLVVTHDDDTKEALAFASVVEAAMGHGLPVAMPDDANDAAFVRRVETLAPDFIFSFYYRQMFSPQMLALATRGALNMHGSLLPRYRGRAPVNWAVIRGETETGATLHYMTEKADAGDIVDQQRVPIAPDDTAFEVFRKITYAAEIVLWRSLPALIGGDVRRVPQDPAKASHFGRRRPEDGRIDWKADATTIHNLVRGVAPPYPGAYTIARGRTLRVLKTAREPARMRRGVQASLYCENGLCFADCGGGGVLRVLEPEVDGQSVAPAALVAALGASETLVLEPCDGGKAQ